MSKLTTFTCDGCGTVKKAANKWWKMAVPKDHPVTYATFRFDDDITLARHGEPHDHVYDFCGESCLAAAEAIIRSSKRSVPYKVEGTE